MSANIIVAWSSILAGLISGAVIGLFFHRDDWLGGHGAWRRRLLRLGHISFFGTAFLNLGFATTAAHLGMIAKVGVPAQLFIVGTIAMPLVCFLSAWRKPFRHLFAIPVASLIGASGLFLAQLAAINGVLI